MHANRLDQPVRQLLISLLTVFSLLACGLLPTPPTPPAATATAVQEQPAVEQQTAPPTPRPDLWPTLPAAAAQLPQAEQSERPAGLDPFLGGGVSYVFTTTDPPLRFQLSATAGATYYLVLIPDGALDGTLSVFDEAGNEIAAADARPAGGGEILELVNPTDRLLTIQIGSIGDPAAGGRLSLYNAGGSFQTELLAVEEEVADDDFNRYELNLTAGRPVVLQVTPLGEFDPVFELYAPSGFLFIQDEGTTSETEQTVFLPPTTGEYAVLIFGYRLTPGRFRFTATEFE